MNRSSVALIPCFKAGAALVLATAVSSVMASPLTDADLALADQAKQIADDARQQEMPEWLQNMHAEQAAVEAQDLVAELQETNPTLKKMRQLDMEKGVYRDHTTLVFASRSLGRLGLEDLLDAVSGQPDTVVVLRGIPKGMNLGDGLLMIQQLAAAKDPVPNIILNPNLFKEYNVTSVPTIIKLDQGSAPGEHPKPLARVSGLSDPAWLAREIEHGNTGDFGIRGPIKDISEPDLIEVAKERFVNIDWDQKKQQAVERFWSKQQFNLLPAAQKARTREVDPTVVVTRDISTPSGTLIAKAGTRVNPLDTRPFTQAVVVFDPLDKKQMKLLDEALPGIKQEPGVQRVTYIATQFDSEIGWDSYTGVSDRFDAPIYLLTPDLITRFELEHTPSVITATDKVFVVRELAVKAGQ